MGAKNIDGQPRDPGKRAADNISVIPQSCALGEWGNHVMGFIIHMFHPSPQASCWGDPSSGSTSVFAYSLPRAREFGLEVNIFHVNPQCLGLVVWLCPQTVRASVPPLLTAHTDHYHFH